MMRWLRVADICGFYSKFSVFLSLLSTDAVTVTASVPINICRSRWVGSKGSTVRWQDSN